MDFSKIRGQHHAVRAIEIALTGNHNLLITGGVGSGKTALILAIEETGVRSTLDDGRVPETGSLNYDIPVIMTTRPCPCGNYLSDEFECVCTSEEILKHRAPLKQVLYSIDMFIYLIPLSFEQIIDTRPSESSETIIKRVTSSSSRLANVSKTIDSDVSPLLKSAHMQLRLQTGMVFRIMNVARTIAAMAEDQDIEPVHMAEAIQYRDRSMDNIAGRQV